MRDILAASRLELFKLDLLKFSLDQFDLSQFAATLVWIFVFVAAIPRDFYSCGFFFSLNLKANSAKLGEFSDSTPKLWSFHKEGQK